MPLTDFNDLHVSAGLDAVRQRIQAAVDPAERGTGEDPGQVGQAGEDGSSVARDIPPVESYSKITDSPRPSGDLGRPTLDQALDRYALTMPDAKVWDSREQRMLKQAAVRALWGKELFEQWKEHEERRTVDQSTVQSAAKAADLGGRGGIALALARYVYLYPTDSAWDRQLRDVVPLSGLRYAIADCFDDWLKHPNRQQINREDLVFDPTQQCDPQSTINMFRGLPLRPAGEIADCEHILQLTWHVVNKDRAVWNWFISWLAYPLQHVGAKMATAVLMHSETQGSGKSLLFDEVMQRIYGEYGATLGQHQLDSQYTDWRSQKLFCLFEEVFSRDQKYSHTGTLKHMVTGRTHRIEKKFVSGWEEANHMNAVFLSNEVQPFPVEPTDRRMLVIWPRSTLPVDIQTMALQEIHNGGIEAFYAWLLNWDLGDFHPHTKPPMNEEKERLIDFGRPGWDTFYREWERGDLDVPYCSCLTTDLFRVYERWCSRRREHVLSHTKFSGLIATRCRRRRDVWYDLGVNRLKGIFFVVGEAPDGTTQSRWLGECVSAFQKAMNADDDRYGSDMP